MRKPLILTVLLLGACSSPRGPYPSLQPRAAEAIDPRVQPTHPMNDRPVASALASQLAELISEAHGGDAAFAAAIGDAERLASSAGAPQSESWIAAQEALSAAIAARKPTAFALSNIDGLGARVLRAQGGIAPNDLKAIEQAAAEVSAMASAQTDRIDAIQKRLGI